MYGGAPRAQTTSGSGARFLLDKGGKVSHFNYFTNERTVQAIASALLDDVPADFAAIGPLSWAGEDASGTRGCRALRGRRDRRAAGGIRPPRHPRLEPEEGRQADLARRSLRQQPAVARVGPGNRGERRARRADRQRLRRPDRATRRHARGDPVRVRLAPPGRGRGAPSRRRGRGRARRARDEPAAGAHRRAFDGRPGRPHDGAREARDVEAHDGARRRTGPDARHAERRLVVADADALGRRHLRQRACRVRLAVRQQRRACGDGGDAGLHATAGGAARPGARASTAATPGKKLADDDLERLLERSIWHDEGVQRDDLPVERAAAGRARPGGRAAPEARRAGGGTRRRRAEDAARHRPRAVHAGRLRDGRRAASNTPTTGGDGRVPLSSALLPGVRTWKVDATHGDLPTVAKAFQAYLELLVNGETASLDPLDPASVVASRSAAIARARGAAVRRAGVQPSAPPSTPADVLGIPGRMPGEAVRTGAASRALHVAVLNADLKFVHQPLVVGHYRALALTGTEAVVDKLVGKAMSRSLAAGALSGRHRHAPDLRQRPQGSEQRARDGAPARRDRRRARRRGKAARGRPRLHGAPGGDCVRAAARRERGTGRRPSSSWRRR